MGLKFYLFAILNLIIINSHSQNLNKKDVVLKLDSMHIQQFDLSNNKWNVINKSQYSFDDKFNNILELGLGYNNIDSKFTKNYKIEREYNSNNLLLSNKIYNWNTIINDWMPFDFTNNIYDSAGKFILSTIYNDNNSIGLYGPSLKKAYQYDIEGKMILENDSIWNNSDNAWELNGFREYSYALNSGKNNKIAYYELVNSDFVIADSSVYKFDSRGNIISINKYFFSNGSLNAIYNYSYTYDFNGNLLQFIHSITTDMGINPSYINMNKTEYTYDQFNNVMSNVYSKWNDSLDIWDLETKNIYEYDYQFRNIIWPYYSIYRDGINPFNKLKNISIQSFINDQWKDSYKQFYYYSPIFKSSMPEFDFQPLSIYPNPTNGFLKINSGNTNINGVEVSDIMGKIVFIANQSNKQNEMQIDLSDLNNGGYFVQVCTEDLNKSVSKIILAK